MTFVLAYHEHVVERDIHKLPAIWRRRIQKAIEQKLPSHPEVYGKPLRRSLKGYRKLRVGDYRIIFRIEKQKVKIFMIAHRSVVYKLAEQRVDRDS